MRRLCNRSAWRVSVLLLLLAFSPSTLSAHPVPEKLHDRTITVTLTPTAARVEYRLEINELTVVYDLTPLLEKEDIAKFQQPREFYAAFIKAYAPVLADNLTATFDGKPLTFTPVKESYQGPDRDGSLVCNFTFEARWDRKPGEKGSFTFREGNYELESGRINLSLVGDGVTLTNVVQPDEELKKRPLIDLKPGEEPKLRKASAGFEVTGDAKPAVEHEPEPESSASTLLMLLLDTRQGMLILLALSAVLGAAHALTPGHGKTLVAAYLVGERGTVWHAVLLGVVTTLTHTGAVLILAALLPYLFPQVNAVLGLIGGLLITGTGFWLILRRLSGQADHVHLFGDHHHHHHGHEHSHVHLPAKPPVGVWGLVTLGISGGIVPCTDAIAMLAFAISAGRLWLALPLLLAFSAGLAGVLILIGIVVVSVKGALQSRLGDGRVFKALPLVSAILVTCLGVWLCYDSVHGQAPEERPAISSGGQAP